MDFIVDPRGVGVSAALALIQQPTEGVRIRTSKERFGAGPAPCQRVQGQDP